MRITGINFGATCGSYRGSFKSLGFCKHDEIKALTSSEEGRGGENSVGMIIQFQLEKLSSLELEARATSDFAVIVCPEHLHQKSGE